MGYKGGFLTQNLSALTLGSATLTPAFDPNVTSYSANITDETTTLTATAESSGATVVTKLNGVAFTGSTVTWTENTDTLTIEVTAGGYTKTYTVTVTHTV